jgi:ferric-dicitrate binding protein FerR (iron transport regulator)
MSRNRESSKNTLDRVAEAIRNETHDPAIEAAAADRVRRNLGLPEHRTEAPAGRIERCEGFRSRIPALLAGSLPPAEALLVEDHTRSCVPCRRALIEARVGAQPAAVRLPVQDRRVMRRVAAVAAVVTLAVAGWLVRDRMPVAPESLTVVEAGGGLWRMDGAVATALRPGEAVSEEVPIRTERGAGAVVRMADGSRVELRNGSEMRVSRKRDGATVHLARGSVIVEAAPQGRGRLHVATGDALATVRGTVFTVHNGLGGSRVSVLEGSVAVSAGGTERALGPGEQFATGSARPVPIVDEVSWSVDPARYETLLAEIAALRSDLSASVRGPAPRTASRLLHLVPADTAVYLAVPNLAEAIDQAASVFRSHLDKSPALREWWVSRIGSADAEAKLEEALARMREVGSVLGDEIVVAFRAAPEGGILPPLLLAEVRDAAALSAILEREKANADPEFAVRVEGDLAVAGPRIPVAGFRAAPAPIELSPFRARLAEAYADGAGWVFGADLEALRGSAEAPAPAVLLGVRQVIAERTEVGGRTRTGGRLVLAEGGGGLASWLGSPGPMAALEYFSPEATAAASVLVRSPRQALAELFERVAGENPEFPRHLDTFRAETGLDPLEDLARPLGQEFAIALDGPALPVPSWKLILEVYDPLAVENALEVLVTRLNESARERGETVTLRIHLIENGGRIFRSIAAEGRREAAWFVFDRGYLVAGPSRAVVEDALARRASGAHLASSPRFLRAIAEGGRSEFTAIAWERLAGLRDAIPVPAAKALLEGDANGRLLTVRAEAGRIEFAMDDDGTLGTDLGSILSMIAAGP